IQPRLALEPVESAGAVTLVGEEHLPELLAAVTAAGEVSLFGLWDGQPRSGRQVGMGVSTGERAWYVPAHLASALRSALVSKPLLGHDVKEMQLALTRFGPGEHQWRFSTHLAAYLLGAGSRDPRLEDLAREFLGMQLVAVDQLLGTGRNARPAAQGAPPEAAHVAGGRAHAVFPLHLRLAPDIVN